MRSRFEPDTQTSRSLAAKFIDPEAFDASEQQFAASLEEYCPAPAAEGNSVQEAEVAATPDESEAAEAPPAPLISQANFLRPEGSDSWRREVASRVSNYRARRRPREPHYPSLQLRFEADEPAHTAAVKTAPAASQTSTRAALAVQAVQEHQPHTTVRADTGPKAYAGPVPDDPAETTARIIPFPRSAVAPPRPLEELAGPVRERPRILEVPEVTPPLPALGGILIEPAQEPLDGKNPGIEVPLQPALLWRRVLAAAIDTLLTASALSLFIYLFFRITAGFPSPRQAAEWLTALAAVFWAGYQYLHLVHSGTTPGLRLARLRLSRFAGTPVPRRLRRWRVLASILSAVSLGLGYAWCILDEDELCWHDRITGTYLAPRDSRPI